MVDFGELKIFIDDEAVTDINFNGQTLWIDDLNKGRFQVTSFENKSLIEKISYQIANITNQPFNVSFPILEAEIDNLRISIFHPSVAASGLSLSIRKTLNRLRYNLDYLIESNFASKEVLELLPKLVINHFNILVSGLPGVGKTELIKYLASYIPAKERVITLEDTLEMRYHKLFPKKDGVALKISKRFSYQDGIKASLRQRPDWLCVSEIRGEEVLALLESVSTGAKLLSTVHAESAASIPKRLLHMFPGIELTNQALLQIIYETFDVGIHLKSELKDGKIRRYLSEIIYIEVSENFEIKSYQIYNYQEKLVLPEVFLKRLVRSNDVLFSH